MPLKESSGNMYDWVTHTHTHLGGECPHKCRYCYVQNNRFGPSPRYRGAIRLLYPELDVDYGSGKTIFIEHMNDMFAKGVPHVFISRIIRHCLKYLNNKYVFQTKDPFRAIDEIIRIIYPRHFGKFRFMLGTTIETNRDTSAYSNAPEPHARYLGLLEANPYKIETFVTLEPIMDFDVDELAGWVIDINPAFVNIGADSKRCSLPEPSALKVAQLIDKLRAAGIEIKKKTNLGRILI